LSFHFFFLWAKKAFAILTLNSEISTHSLPKEPLVFVQWQKALGAGFSQATDECSIYNITITNISILFTKIIIFL